MPKPDPQTTNPGYAGEIDYAVALHEQSVGATDEWYTPKYVFDAMDVEFDTDVASPGKDIVHWIPAKYHITKDSFNYLWHGVVWMNPPFGGRNGIDPWLDRFFEVRLGGVALTPDRTSAPWWQKHSAKAEKILFVSPKIKFIGADGTPGQSPAQGTTLMSFGSVGNNALVNAAGNGLGVLR